MTEKQKDVGTPTAPDRTSVLRCPHVLVCSITAQLQPPGLLSSVHPGTSCHLGQQLCLPAVYMLRAGDAEFTVVRVARRFGIQGIMKESPPLKDRGYLPVSSHWGEQGSVRLGSLYLC